MLALQIALGIVLAAVVLRFWRESLLVAGGLVVLSVVIVAVLLGWRYLWMLGAGIIAVSVLRPLVRRIPPDHRRN